VVFATKPGDTDRAARSLEPVIHEGTSVISLQNGIEGPEIIAAALPAAHVVPGVARISSHIARPGVIEHKTPFARIEFGDFDGKASSQLGAFHAASKAAGIDAQINDSAPLSGTFEELAKTAPKSDEQTRPRSEVFSDLTRIAPHAEGVFADWRVSRAHWRPSSRLQATSCGRSNAILQPVLTSCHGCSPLSAGSRSRARP